MIKEIVKKYDVMLYEVTQGDNHCEANGEDSYHNTSYCAGNIHSKCGMSDRNNCAEIWLGFYDDEEIKLISFFHELGHVTDDTIWNDKLLKYDMEKIAWNKGYEIAKEYGVKFSRKSKGWATKQLNTYKGWEEREISGWEELKKEKGITS